MTASPLLGPVVALVAWSLIVLTYLAIARFRGIKRAGLKVDPSRGGRGQDLEGVIDAKANWPAHNYAHLMEQPTVFYATAVILAIVGAGAADILAAWIYVGLRIVHSVWQSTVNTVTVRFALFIAATFALLFLGVRAVVATVLADPSALPA